MSRSDFLDLETPISDAFGEALLLGLAVDDIFDRPVTEKVGEYFVYHLTEDQLTAINYARYRVVNAVRDLSDVFGDKMKRCAP